MSVESEIGDLKTQKARVLFGRIYKWAIEPPVI